MNNVCNMVQKALGQQNSAVQGMARLFRAALCVAVIVAFPAVAFAQRVEVDSTWRDDVKTVILSRPSSDQEEPLLMIDEQAHRLLLQFDVLTDTPEALRWTIKHCDADWQADGLEPYDFMQGFEYGTIDNYEFSFTTLTPYIHYSQTLPAAGARFIYSGNYLLTVTIDGEEDSVLLTRRFRVTEQSVKLTVEMALPFDGIANERRQEVDAYIEPLPGEMGVVLNQQYLRVIAQQNGRLDLRRELEFSGYSGVAMAYRGRRPNVFDGGNTFRFFDLSNLRTPMYNVQRVERYGGETFAIITPCENRSRRHYTVDAALNGGFKINVFDRNNPLLEADYVWVNLTLPADQPLMGGSVHVVGALTDWRLDDGSRMDYSVEYKAYTKRLLLKQGYYSYQLLYLPVGATEAETAAIEGDHRETPNSYTVNVYYRTPADLADRLLAVRTIVAH